MPTKILPSEAVFWALCPCISHHAASLSPRLGAAVVVSQSQSHAAEVDDALIAILNDTHIGAQQSPKASIQENLRHTISWLLALPKRPAAVIINGDLALKDGRKGDYEQFAKLIEPLRAAGVALHLTMGNHDNLEAFYGVLSAERPGSPAVMSKHVSLVQLAGVNLFLLDTLKETMVTQGLIGEAQMSWLKQRLDEHADRPALLFAHHNPRLGGDPLHFPGGLEDSDALWEALATRKHVKAYIHGHIHHRDYFSHAGVHILNTPATSYVADKKTSTTGWTMLRLTQDGAEVTTHTHQPDHAWNGEMVPLKWRA
ncbi:MAG: metallophosphoesterase [Verrucomicrobiaceae bacterium]|nr:metallophosphoesterase [Verrucomicrobiaceae bacterium]